MTFSASEKQHFGFDGSFKEEFKTDYPSIRVGGKSYRSAWKSLKSNTPDQVIATDPANQDLTFEFNGTPVTATSGADDTYSLTLTGQSDEVEGELLVKVGDYLAGQLNTISYDNVEQVVKIVPINGAGGGITQGQLQTKLNEIYGVAIASWNVEVLANQNLGTAWDDEGNGLEVGDNSTLSNYTSEMNDLIRAFKQNNDRDKKAYYVFLVNKAESSTYLGYMPRKKQWGFVFTEGQSTDQLITTIAHELGHGVYRLEHTFSEKGIPKGQTQNLMDYAGGTDLYKYQWDYVHDPESVVTLFDDEEDAAYEADDEDKVKNILELFRCAYVNETQALYQLDEYELITHDITLLDDVEYEFVSVNTEFNTKDKQFTLDPSSQPVISSASGKTSIKFTGSEGHYISIKVNDSQKDKLLAYLKPAAATWTNQIDVFVSSLDQLVSQNSAAAKDAVYMLASCGTEKISLKVKFDFIKLIADEWLVDSDDQELVLKVLSAIMTENEAKSFLEKLSNDDTGLLSELEDEMTGEQYRRYHNSLARLFFISKGESLKQEIETLSSNTESVGQASLEEWVKRKVFFWLNPGFVKRFSETSGGYLDYSDFDIADNGVISFDIENIALVFSLDKFPVEIQPFDLIRVQLLTSSKDLNGGTGQGHFYLPAINLSLLVNEQSWDEFNQALNSGFIIASFGSGALVQGGRAAIFEAVFTSLNVAALVVDDYRYELTITEEGQVFLQSWEVFNAALAIWQVAKITVALPKAYKSLKDSYQAFKAKYPNKAANISDEVDDILKQTEDAFDEIVPASGVDDLVPTQLDGARARVRTKYGSDYVDITLRSKYGDDFGAAAVVADKYGDAGKRILDDAANQNLDDVAKALIRDKDIMRFYDQHMYRAVNETSYNFDKLKSTGVIDAAPAQYPTYVSLDDFSDAAKAKDVLQLPKSPTWVAEFDAAQVVGDVRFPKGKFNQAEYTEVVTQAFPEWGTGGGSQFITNSEIQVSKLKNLVTGEVIDFNAIRRTLAGLKADTKFKAHLFNGEISKTIPEGQTQPRFNVSGVHHSSAVDNVKVRISNKSTPDANGVYTAKVEMYHEDLKPINGTGWKKKNQDSSFFPDSWGQDRVLREVSHAFENKNPVQNSTNKFRGKSSDGVIIEMFINNGVIDTAYPVKN